jgi:hypothetical protein
MSFWNHRVIHRYDEKHDVHTYRIHEVYYDDDGSIEGWTEKAMAPVGETPAQLREDIRHLMKAFQKPILTEQIEDGKETLVSDEDVTEFNQGHYAEFLDRAWVAIDYIYQFLGSHPLLRKEKRLRDIYRKAEDALSDLYQEAGKLEYGLEPNSRQEIVC